MQQHLHLFPSKVQILQFQTAANKVERRKHRSSNRRFLGLHFLVARQICTLRVHVSKQSRRFWAQTQPYEHQYHPLSAEKVTVWCTLGRNGIIGR